MNRVGELNSDAERAQALAWLATGEGEALIAAAQSLPDDRLTRLSRLRRQANSALVAAAVEQAELRQRGHRKFADADRMFFTREGLEQSTADAIASYRAARFRPGEIVLDACCGIGGDACSLAGRGPVLAVDVSAAAAMCTALNSSVFRSNVPGAVPVRALCADVTTLPLRRLADRGVRAAFFDPSRRADSSGGGRRRLRSHEDYAPPLQWVDELRSHFESVAVKASPAIDDAALRYPGVRVEFISDRGECKEAVLWFGSSAEPLDLPPRAVEPYFATVLRPDEPPATLTPFSCPEVAVREVAEYIFEPNPAVIRAHLIPQLAASIQGSWIEPGVAYLTGDRMCDTTFASAFRVIEQVSFNQKEIQRRLRALGAHVCAVKKRGIPIDPAGVQKGLKPCGERALEMILMRRAGRAIAILCDRVKENDTGCPG